MTSKAEQTRQQIIDTADDLFYRQGFDHTSFTDIADAAGIARGNFYYHFKTKDELLSAVIEARCAGIRAMLNDWERELPQPRYRLQRFIQILIMSQPEIKEHGCPMGSLCIELVKLRHALQYAATDMFDIFRQWLCVQFKLLGYAPDKADQLALHLIARAQGIALVSSAYRDTEFMEREVVELIEWVEQI